MLKINSWQLRGLPAVVLTLLCAPLVQAQVQVGGDFMMRHYWEKPIGTLDDRADLNYARMLGRIYLDTSIGELASFHTDFVTISENPVFPPRAFSGTGELYFGISQIYGEIITPAVPLADLSRFRVGRQHYELGQGLTLGDSYYMTNNYDGARADFTRGNWTLGLMGAITAQELTEGGYYPQPGNDQIYVGKLEYELYSHSLLAYSVYERPQGDYNDNIVTGLGAKGSIVLRNLKYFGEVATQRYNTAQGLPEKGGMGYMAGLAYNWSTKAFRSIKVEVRAAGYEGDDATTDKVEIFSPYYPSWFWGDRTAYVNGSTGGDYPHGGIRPEGSRVWYGRIYFSPTAVPKARLQFQYAVVGDWVNNDDYTEPYDEFGVKLFYDLSSNVRLQGRYFRRIANGEDADLNGSGTITGIEDRYDVQRIMFELRLQF